MFWRNYGPNGSQVKAFISKLKSLPDERWLEAAALRAPSAAAYGSLDLSDVETAYRSRHRNISALNSALEDLRRAVQMNWDIQLMTEVAVIGLVACDVLTVGQFAAAYAPFSSVIPVQSLGVGKAPNVVPPPDTLEERFVLRLHSLSPEAWEQIARIAYVVQDAVGVEAIDAAIDATFEIIEDRLRRAELDADRFGNLLIQAARCVPTGFDEGRRVVQNLGERFDMGDWASALTARWEAKLDVVRVTAQRAVTALTAGEGVTTKNFAILYAPFAALIPQESLEGRS